MMGILPSVRKDLQAGAEIKIRENSISYSADKFGDARILAVGFHGYGTHKKSGRIDFRCGFVNVLVEGSCSSVWGGDIIEARPLSIEEFYLHESKSVRSYIQMIKKACDKNRAPKNPFFWPLLYSHKEYVAMVNRSQRKNRKWKNVPERPITFALGMKFSK